METYDLDLEIVMLIKNGNHRYNKIWEKAKHVTSKQTFTDYLKRLVAEKVIIRKLVDGRPEYNINDIMAFDKTEQIQNYVKNKILLMDKISKNKSGKKLVRLFVNGTVLDLVMYSSSYFRSLFPYYKTDKNADLKTQKLLESLIKHRIEILREKDIKLLMIYYDLVEKNLTSHFKQFYENIPKK